MNNAYFESGCTEINPGPVVFIGYGEGISQAENVDFLTGWGEG